MQLPDVFRTATFRLAGLYLCLFMLSIAVLLLLIFFQVRNTLQSEARNQILTEFNLLSFEFREDGLEELLEEIDERIEKNSAAQRMSYMVQNPAGRVIFDPIAAVDPPYGWQYIDGDRPALFYFQQLDNGYVLGVGKDMTAQLAVMRATGRALVWSVLGVVALGALGGWFLSRRTLAQLESINNTVRAIGAGNLARRIPLLNTGDELDDLCHTLNQMLERIEQLVINVRQVSTGIAHDLRTPLARLRNRLESFEDSSMPSDDVAAAVREVDGILQTFAALLRLAELEAGTLKSSFQPVALSTLVQQLAEAFAPLAAESGHRIILHASRDVTVNGDKNLLQQLIVNLLENALQHAGANCTIQLSVEHKGKVVLLQIADSGAGIPSIEHERILRPFQRSNDSNGTGLGLSLVVAIAHLHNGSLALKDNNPGLLCEVTLPVLE